MRVPIYEPQAGVQFVPPAPVSAGVVGDGLAAGLQSLAGVASVVGDLARQQQQRDRAQAEADAEIRMIRATTDATRDLADLRGKLIDDPDYATAPQRFDAAARAIGDRYTQGIGDPLRAARFENHFAGLVGTGGVAVREAAQARRRDVAMSSLADTIDTQRRAAADATNPVEYEHAITTIGSAIAGLRDTGVLSAADAGRLAREQLGLVDEEAVRAQLNRDPYAAVSRLQDQQAFRYLDPVRRQQFLSQAVTDVRQLEARREADARQAKAEADATLRADRADLREEARLALQTVQNGDDYQGMDGLIRRAEGLDPDTARRLQFARLDRDWTARFAALSPVDQQAEIGHQRQDLAAAGDAETALSRSERLQTAQRIEKQTAEMLDKDPLGWAMARGVVPEAPIQPGQPDSFSARQRAVATARAHYGRDMPPLTGGEAEAVVRAFDQAETADERWDVLSGITRGWQDPAMGWAALRQLREAKLSPRATYALAVGEEPGRQALGRQLMRELTDPPSKVDLSVATDQARRDVRETAATLYDRGIGAVRQKALSASPRAAFGRRYDEDLDALLTVAQRRVGVADRPAESAYRDLFSTVVPLDDDGLAHLVLPAGTDTGRLATGLQVLRNQAADRLAKLAPQDGDVVQTRQFGRAVVEETRRSGVWVNDGDGMVLIVPGAGEAVTGDDGRPWRVSIDQALAAADGAAAYRAPRDIPLGPLP